jgi:hypothetical protein
MVRYRIETPVGTVQHGFMKMGASLSPMFRAQQFLFDDEAK